MLVVILIGSNCDSSGEGNCNSSNNFALLSLLLPVSRVVSSNLSESEF